MYSIEGHDPWAELCVGDFEDDGDLPEWGGIYIGDFRHSVLDKMQNQEGAGVLLRWEHGGTGEIHITGVFDGKSRTWHYEDFIGWQRALFAVLNWQQAHRLGSRVTAATIKQADRLFRRHSTEVLA